MSLHRRLPRLVHVPVETDTGCLQDSHCLLRELRPGAIPVDHSPPLHCRGGAQVPPLSFFFSPAAGFWLSLPFLLSDFGFSDSFLACFL